MKKAFAYFLMMSVVAYAQFSAPTNSTPDSTAATESDITNLASRVTAIKEWGNHALFSYLTSESDPAFTAWLLATPPLYSVTESDPQFMAWDKSYNDLTDKPVIPSQYTDAMAEAALADELAGKATVAQGTLADNAVQPGDTTAWDKNVADDFDGSWLSLSDVPADIADGDADTQLSETQVKAYVADEFAATSQTVMQVSEKVDDLESGAEDFEGINLEGDLIDDWGDIAPIQGVPQNDPVYYTNSATWSDWATSGGLNGTNITLDSGDYLLSPVFTNGIAGWYISQNGSGRLNWGAYIVTNGVATGEVTYQGDDAQLMITNISPMPMMSPTMDIMQVKVIGYNNSDEAENVKYVSNLRRIDEEYHEDDLTSKGYVDQAEAAAKDYAASSLAAYAANGEKTIVCSRLRIGSEYELIGDGSVWEIHNECSINGAGELLATANGIAISRNGHQLLSFRDSASGVFITNYSFTTWTFEIATNGVLDTPYLEWSPSMTKQDWQRLPTVPVLDGAVYRFSVLDPPYSDTGFVQALQPVGTSAVVIDAQVMTLQDITGGVWQISVSTSGELTTTKE